MPVTRLLRPGTHRGSDAAVLPHALQPLQLAVQVLSQGGADVNLLWLGALHPADVERHVLPHDREAGVHLARQRHASTGMLWCVAAVERERLSRGRATSFGERVTVVQSSGKRGMGYGQRIMDDHRTPFDIRML